MSWSRCFGQARYNRAPLLGDAQASGTSFVACKNAFVAVCFGVVSTSTHAIAGSFSSATGRLAAAKICVEAVREGAVRVVAGLVRLVGRLRLWL